MPAPSPAIKHPGPPCARRVAQYGTASSLTLAPVASRLRSCEPHYWNLAHWVSRWKRTFCSGLNDQAAATQTDCRNPSRPGHREREAPRSRKGRGPLVSPRARDRCIPPNDAGVGAARSWRRGSSSAASRGEAPANRERRNACSGSQPAALSKRRRRRRTRGGYRPERQSEPAASRCRNRESRRPPARHRTSATPRQAKWRLVAGYVRSDRLTCGRARLAGPREHVMRSRVPLYRASPALACIIGARRAWTVEMISSEEIPCR